MLVILMPTHMLLVLNPLTGFIFKNKRYDKKDFDIFLFFNIPFIPI